jgi:hypothetical protein
MSGSDQSADLSPAERSLDEHLQLLRSDPPAAPGTLVSRVVRTARWQRAIRRPLMTAGAIAGAITDGVRLLFGSRGRK